MQSSLPLDMRVNRRLRFKLLKIARALALETSPPQRESAYSRKYLQSYLSTGRVSYARVWPKGKRAFSVFLPFKQRHCSDGCITLALRSKE